MNSGIVIVNYGMGNLNSVKRKLARLGISASISNLPEDILKAEKLILPGVGHFQKAVENIKELHLWDTLNDVILIKKKPILGICLGMQLMAKRSEEGKAEGFGWVNAEVVRFQVKDFLKYKIPHTGWNQITKAKSSTLMLGIPEYSQFYFVHSYHMRCNDTNDILNETEYEYIFTSAIERENIFGIQYHPEKSHDIGDKLLNNFIKL
jgi:imidazole glycerol-phosphate synthase subunit HisH